MRTLIFGRKIETFQAKFQIWIEEKPKTPTEGHKPTAELPVNQRKIKAFPCHRSDQPRPLGPGTAMNRLLQRNADFAKDKSAVQETERGGERILNL